MSRDVRELIIDPMKMTSRNKMAKYLKTELKLPDYFGGNLDALYDCLGEISEDIDIVINRKNLSLFAEQDYAFRTLHVISEAVRLNSHLNIIFR